MNEDIEIIQECLNGNQLAYKKLYEKYIAYCYGICNRYTVPSTDMKDVVQIIFTQVFHSLKNYDAQKAAFKTWFTHVCINNILSYKRKAERRKYDQHFDDLNGLENQFSDNPIEENIDKQYILSIIQQMPEKYQLVFNLFVIDGYSHEEIAKELNITSASSRVTLNRARGWVKKTFVNLLNA